MKELRLAAGLVGRQVGAHFDIDKAAVSEWERGKSAPSRDKLVELDKLYRANGEVLELYGVKDGRLDVLESELSRQNAELVRLGAVVAELSRLVRRSLGAHVDALDPDATPPGRGDAEDDPQESGSR